MREPLTLYGYIKSLIEYEKHYYVLLDEVRYILDFSEVLNLLLQIENKDIYTTASNSKFLSLDIITEFSRKQ